VNKLKKNIKDVIVKDIKMRRGQKTDKTKANKQNNFMFVEFDHKNNIAYAMKYVKDLTH